MFAKFARSTRSAVLAVPLISSLAALASGCAPPGHNTAGAKNCSTDVQPSGPFVIVLTAGTTDNMTRAMSTLANNPRGLARQLRMTGAPTVDLETYDAEGQLTSHGLFNLNGTGNSNRAQDSDASTEATCLKTAVSRLGAASSNPDLVRSLPTAVATAAANGDNGAVVLAFGLGTSAIEKTPLAKVDLTTATARARAITTLKRDNLLTGPTDVPIMIVAPGADVANGIVANDVATFAQDNLCPAVSTACTAPTVLG
jgi:hypothetical protein